MARNYFESKNEKTAKRRRRELEKHGVQNNATAIYDLQLEHFYETYGKNSKKWSNSQRKLYNDINKGFINSGQSTVSEIKKKHTETYGETGDDLITMAQDNDNLELLNDDILREQLGSEVLKDTFHDGEINGYSTEEMRASLTEAVLEFKKQGVDASIFSVSELTDIVLDNIEYRRLQE